MAALIWPTSCRGTWGYETNSSPLRFFFNLFQNYWCSRKIGFFSSSFSYKTISDQIYCQSPIWTGSWRCIYSDILNIKLQFENQLLISSKKCVRRLIVTLRHGDFNHKPLYVNSCINSPQVILWCHEHHYLEYNVHLEVKWQFKLPVFLFLYIL